MIRRAELGKMYPVSNDGGRSWQAAANFPELWEVRDLVASTPVPGQLETATETRRSDPPVIVVAPPPELPESGLVPRHSQDDASSTSRRGGRGLGIAGFITAVTALVLLLVPMIIWMMRYASAYAFIPIVFPFLGAAITGLVLSTVAMTRRTGAFATAGLIVGICASVLGLVTAVGWALSSDPREEWIDRMTKTQDADLQLARRNFDGALTRYRDAGKADRDAARKRLTQDFLILTEAHYRLVKVAASTPRFRQPFEDLESLHVAFGRFKEAIGTKEDLDPVAAIDEVAGDRQKLKLLLDMQELYRTRQLTLETAQAKFRDL